MGTTWKLQVFFWGNAQGHYWGTLGMLLGDNEVTAEGQLWDCTASAGGFIGLLSDYTTGQ